MRKVLALRNLSAGLFIFSEDTRKKRNRNMQKFPENWDLKTKIEFLQRKIILNSIAYYEFNTNFLSDMYYDSICRQLVKLQEEYGDVSDTQYGYVMYDFDGSTGFDLMYRLNESDKEFLMNNVKHHIKGAGPEVGKKERKKVEEKRSDREIVRKPFLYDYQMDAVKRMHNGCILCGSVGSGKSRTGLFYYFKECGGWIDEYGYQPMKTAKDLIIISTAKKRDSLEWIGELGPFLLVPDKNGKTSFGNTITVDSWNNLPKYRDRKNCFFLLDEQRLVSYGAWTKAFLEIAQNNDWVLLSATPADTYSDYLPVFLANGFYRNKTEFGREHIVYARYSKYPKIDRYTNTTRLDRLVEKVLVVMDYHHDIKKNHEDIYCTYDTSKYKKVIRDRWDIYNECPLQDAGGLCRTLRRVVNSDESRQIKLLEILEKHPRAIIFYNHNFERDILLNLAYGEGVEVAEWTGHAHQPVPDSDKWVYICQYTSACEGWNCIKTNCIIFYSQSYSYKVMTQAAGRVDRLNTPFDELYYYHLKSRSGIDLAISKALSQKKKFNERKFAKWD